MQAQIGGDAYKVMEHTQNAAQCAATCAGDLQCAAWTRVAGGRADVQRCYLKSSLSAGTAEASVTMRQLSQVSCQGHTALTSGEPCMLSKFRSGEESPQQGGDLIRECCWIVCQGMGILQMELIGRIV